MKKHTNWIVPLVVVILAVIGFAGWRMWGTEKSLQGEWPELAGGVYQEPVTKSGVKYLVSPDQIYESGLTSEDRPALTDPKFDDIATADAKLADELEGIAVSVGSTHRFYPFQILNWHEVVNNEVNGVPLVVTYSPITGSAVVYEDDRSFSDAGKVYNNAMLMQAEGDDTLWNQTTGQAIAGVTVGERLKMYPSTVMTWEAWKDLHPAGLALSMDTGFARDYGRHPYASYESADSVFFPLNHTFSKVKPKDLVYRVEPVTSVDEPLVFFDRYLPMQNDINAVMGSEDGQRSVAAFYDEDTGIVRVFNRIQDGRVLTFEYKGGTITDKETGSRWSPEGVAISGELRGAALEEMYVTRHYAFVHFAMYPNSLISGEDLLPDTEVPEEGEILEIN